MTVKIRVTGPGYTRTYNWQNEQDVEDLCHEDFALRAVRLVPGECILIECIDEKAKE